MPMIKTMLYLAILTVVVVVSWIGFSVHHSYTTSTISSDTSIRITPIPSGFDMEAIQNLKTKRVVPVDLEEIKVEASITPSPTQIISPGAEQSSPSGQVNL